MTAILILALAAAVITVVCQRNLIRELDAEVNDLDDECKALTRRLIDLGKARAELIEQLQKREAA